MSMTTLYFIVVHYMADVKYKSNHILQKYC